MNCRTIFISITVVVLQACGGSGSTSSAGGASDSPTALQAWIGTWRAVSENGAAASGLLVLDQTSFSQNSILSIGACNWTGSVSSPTATQITLTTNTGTGVTGCANAIGRSASPIWQVSNDNNSLTLDYSAAIPFGTVQIWTRI